MLTRFLGSDAALILLASTSVPVSPLALQKSITRGDSRVLETFLARGTQLTTTHFKKACKRAIHQTPHAQTQTQQIQSQKYLQTLCILLDFILQNSDQNKETIMESSPQTTPDSTQDTSPETGFQSPSVHIVFTSPTPRTQPKNVQQSAGETRSGKHTKKTQQL
ncbi:hypothetical protein M1146_03575 [Patescibacteria group bacterium]|nr:hypothetical protein [Patescibacteria group bacterium]